MNIILGVVVGAFLFRLLVIEEGWPLAIGALLLISCLVYASQTA